MLCPTVWCSESCMVSSSAKILGSTEARRHKANNKPENLPVSAPDQCYKGICTSCLSSTARRNRQIRFAIIRLCAQGVAKPFLSPVDRSQYPDYEQIVENPVDLGLIAERYHQAYSYSILPSYFMNIYSYIQIGRRLYRFKPSSI